jgi:hypothetical protein
MSLRSEPTWKYPFSGGLIETQEFDNEFIWSDGNPFYHRFGMTGHNGNDIIPIGEDWNIYNFADGIVIKDEEDPNRGYGISIVIWYKQYNVAIRYAHMAYNLVSVDQEVKKDNILGKVGATGNVTGAHLHWEVIPVDENGYRIDVNNGHLGSIDGWWLLQQINAINTVSVVNTPVSIPVVEVGDFYYTMKNGDGWTYAIKEFFPDTDLWMYQGDGRSPSDVAVQLLKEHNNYYEGLLIGQIVQVPRNLPALVQARLNPALVTPIIAEVPVIQEELTSVTPQEQKPVEIKNNTGIPTQNPIQNASGKSVETIVLTAVENGAIDHAEAERLLKIWTNETIDKVKEIPQVRSIFASIFDTLFNGAKYVRMGARFLVVIGVLDHATYNAIDQFSNAFLPNGINFDLAMTTVAALVSGITSIYMWVYNKVKSGKGIAEMTQYLVGKIGFNKN